MRLRIVNTLLISAALLPAACSSLLVPDPIDLTEDMIELEEPERLRWLEEVNAVEVLNESQLTGEGVRVTIMGEFVDPNHPDLKGAVVNQFNAFVDLERPIRGTDDLPFKAELMGKSDGHGTHIAGTITAACDGTGIQGLSCNASIDVYDLGLYDNSVDWIPGASELDIFSRVISAYASGIRHITTRGESRITTGSFNLESPAIEFSEESKLFGASIADIVNDVVNEIDGSDEFFDRGYAVFKNPSDRDLLERMIEKNEGDDMIALSAALTISSDWRTLEEAIASYQAADGVYLVTESNYDFESLTSTLNALPSFSDKVDDELWLSVVMVMPDGLDELDPSYFEEKDAFRNWLKSARYSTPINSCGEIAASYCIVTPSWGVLSTMTETVSEPYSPLLFVDGRTYQSFDGHSMGAPMVAATLALMEEENIRKGYGYSMKDLVRILKENANRSFNGYNEAQHGVGMLDVAAAINGMQRDE